nr:AlpA family phage regulatory protein [Actinoplanes sp. N902-109]
MLDVSRSRVYQVTQRDDFPEPVAELLSGKVWLENDVRNWLDGKRKQREKAEAKTCHKCPFMKLMATLMNEQS